MTAPLVVTTRSAMDTWRLGEALGRAARGGECIALDGPLGAGKTQFTKGVAAGLGIVDSRAVNSPTYVVVNEYHGRLRVHHLDAYRLTGAAALEDLGFQEMLAPDALTIVEWAPRVASSLTEALWIHFTVVTETVRRIAFPSPGAAGDHLIAACAPFSDRSSA